MRYNKTLIGGIASVLIITGCSTASIQPKGRLDYLDASSINPLELPPDLIGSNSTSASDNTATQMLSEYQKQVSSRNNLSNRILVSSDAVKIERSGDTRWIATTLPADYVWSRVIQVFQELGLRLEVQNPEAGILESAWAENRADVPDTWIRQLLKSTMDNMFSSPTRDKFRVRLERGNNGQVLIYVTHYGMRDKTSGNDDQFHTWVDRPKDPELEAEFVARIAAKLGVQNPQEVNQGDDVAVISEVGDGVNINKPLTSIWMQTGNILDDGATFKVESLNNDENSMIVLQRDPKKMRGSRLAFWKDREAIYYRFKLTLSSQGKNETHIAIQSLDGEPTNQVIQRLRSNLH